MKTNSANDFPVSKSRQSIYRVKYWMSDTFARFLFSSDVLSYFALQNADSISSICIIRARQTTQVDHLHSHGLKNQEEPPTNETLADSYELSIPYIDVTHKRNIRVS